MLSRGFKDQIYDIFQLLPPKLQVGARAGSKGTGTEIGGAGHRRHQELAHHVAGVTALGAGSASRGRGERTGRW